MNKKMNDILILLYVTLDDACVFPFKYKGVTYNSCTKKNHNKYWCSKDAVYKGRWKNCIAGKIF